MPNVQFGGFGIYLLKMQMNKSNFIFVSVYNVFLNGLSWKYGALYQ